MRHFRGAALLLSVMFAWTIRADSITETFFSRAGFDSGTAVWNQALGRLHTTLHVMNFKAGFTPLDISVGDGSDGPFDVSTYASFSVNGDLSGNTIRLDTDVHPVLNVTVFHLAAGWILKPVGSSPLIIQSLSDVIIEGQIRCDGDAGQDGSGATAGAGGSGRCGGLDGGAGGDPGLDGTGGTAADFRVRGGQAGNFTGGAAVGGGGGGGWSLVAAGNGANSSGAGGQAGAHFSDPEFLTIAGGASGAGGSGTGTDGGGGGGASGGVVLITAARDLDLGTAPASATGFILVNGGGGGGSNVNGGAGGGGGGGSVQAFVGGTINIYNTDAGGASQAMGGAGGVNSSAAAGGAGGRGRSWFSSVVFNGVGFYTPTEEAPITRGNVEFTTTPETIISQSIDTENSAPTLYSLTTTPVSADFALQAAGSSDNFISDDTGFSSNFALLNGKRYVKFMVTITTTNVNTPDMVSALNITYTPNVLTEFKFTGGCGSVGGNANASPWNLLLVLAPFIFLISLKLQAEQKKSRQ